MIWLCIGKHVGWTVCDASWPHGKEVCTWVQKLQGEVFLPHSWVVDMVSHVVCLLEIVVRSSGPGTSPNVMSGHIIIINNVQDWRLKCTLAGGWQRAASVQSAALGRLFWLLLAATWSCFHSRPLRPATELGQLSVVLGTHRRYTHFLAAGVLLHCSYHSKGNTKSHFGHKLDWDIPQLLYLQQLASLLEFIILCSSVLLTSRGPLHWAGKQQVAPPVSPMCARGFASSLVM